MSTNPLSVQKSIKQYLKERNLPFEMIVSDSGACLVVSLLDCENCPGKLLGVDFYFRNNCIEVKVHYGATATKWIKERKNHLASLYRLLNYINAMVWMPTNDGQRGEIYPYSYFYTPRFIITEDGSYDLCCSSFVDYDVFELAPLATLDYFTAVVPAYFDELSLPIFLLLLEKVTVEQAIQMIRDKNL